MEEWRAKQSNSKQATKESDCFEAGSAFTLPVNIAQIKPERELIQRERRRDAIDQASETGEPNPAAGVQQPHISS